MRTHVRPLKGLGQHFLNSPEFAAKIADSLTRNDSYDQVLEIGPGTGVLTNYLLRHTGKKLFCIEVDDRSVQYLESNFPELEGQIIYDDFLHAPLTELGEKPFAVIGN